MTAPHSLGLAPTSTLMVHDQPLPLWPPLAGACGSARQHICCLSAAVWHRAAWSASHGLYRYCSQNCTVNTSATETFAHATSHIPCFDHQDRAGLTPDSKELSKECTSSVKTLGTCVPASSCSSVSILSIITPFGSFRPGVQLRLTSKPRRFGSKKLFDLS
ncbi:hypothetical protein LX36DRAFT_354382 [Colletotrichum falcatum]|nr:hypothetical protein LX36DRAFT_354382 [Colletotrichum falcatum]